MDNDVDMEAEEVNPPVDADHEYSRLVESKYNRLPAYAETVEISTTEPIALEEINCESAQEIECKLFASGKKSLQKCDSSFDKRLQGDEMMIPLSLGVSVESDMKSCMANNVKVVTSARKNDPFDADSLIRSVPDVRVVLNSKINKMTGTSVNISPCAESIDIETNEEIVSNGVSNYEIDFTNIADHVIDEPIVLYHYGQITLKCTKLNDKIYTKSFECSTLGLGDKEALIDIQNFVNSKECIRRLTIVEKLDISNIAEYVTDDVRLTRVSNNYVRLVCRVPDGRTVTKTFPGTELGIKDPDTRRQVQEFLDSDEGRKWIMKGANARKGNWVKVGEVSTGSDTKKFITNNVKFDVNQRFIYKKEALEVLRDEDVLLASTSSHVNWGTTHRSDDQFALKVPPEDVAKIVLARFHLECASLTNKCKTQCGAPVSDVTIINGKFSCCGMVKEVQVCSNCMIDNTSQWYRLEDSTVCNSCYKFYQRRGVHRPYCRKYSRKERIHEPHTKCDWKMKLELSGDDITKWIIYEHTTNAKDHNINIPCQTRPTLVERDKWDKLRSLAKLTPKQILLSESHLRDKMPEIQNKIDSSTFQSVRTRANLIDSRKKNSDITVENGIPISKCKKTSRITVEKIFEHLVFLQGETKGESREYHLVICPADSIENLSELEIPINCNAEQTKFKNGIIVVYYDPHENVAAAFLISCMEGGLGLAISHELTFKIMNSDDHWSSILQREKYNECRHDFKPVPDEIIPNKSLKISKKGHSNPNAVFNFTNIIDLVTEKPRVVKVSDTRVRLQCVLPGGKFLTKVFPCSSLGIQDPETQRTIQAFIDSKDCRLWIESKGVDNWVRLGEVTTGIDTEQYLHHTINFEVMQRFFYSKKVLDIIHDGSTMLSALSKPEGLKTKSRSRPGIHKVGDKFTLKLPVEEVGNKVVATMYIDCASTSDNCKTKCGKQARDVAFIDGLFTCCGLPRQEVNVCCNCLSDNSDRWSKIGENNFLCHTCHNYYRRKNHHRPTSMIKTKKKKIHESHVKCEWKMKLELRAADITKWQIFKYHLNNKAHESKATSSQKKRSEVKREERPLKKMKVFNDKEFNLSNKECTKIIKAFPRYAAGSATGWQIEQHTERPDENGFLMYPEIKEYITGLVLRDIICPKEIRLYISQYACENFLVTESVDNKYNQSTIYELRTLVKGFIYYVQSDINACSKTQESKKLMICLGNRYPTLYFVQESETQIVESGEIENEIELKMEMQEYVEDDKGLEVNEEAKQIIPNQDFITQDVIQEDTNSKVQNSEDSSVHPMKIFVTTGVCKR